MITDLTFYLTALPAVLITGLAKGAFGISMGILAVPLVAFAIPISQAAGILLPILLAMDAFSFWVYRRHWDGLHLRRLLPGAMLGLALGTAMFHALPERAVRIVLGAIAVAFTLHYWLRPRPQGPPRTPPPWVGWLAGTASGITSFVAHAGAPPASIYLLPLRLDKTRLTGTTVTYFTVLNAIKLAPYAWLGLLAPGNLETSLALGPVALVGVGLGVLLHRALSMAAFYRLSYGLVFLAGLKLLYDGLAPLLG
ncbi:MAG TPA: sulfite exporter TauE/SafE family protein [bacterium]